MSEVETAQTGAEVAPVDTPAIVPDPQAQGTESTPEQVDAQADKPRDDKGRFVPQERVNEITRARREAERRVQYLEQQLQAVQSQQPQRHQPQSNEQPPSIADFNTVEEWGAAIADYSARQALSQAEQRFQQHDQHRSQQQLAQTFATKEQAYAAANPDYLDRVAELTSVVQFAPEVMEAIGVSDHGPAVAHYLANHLDEADRISRLPPHIAAVQIGRIEAQVSAPKARPVTKAPDPAPLLGGGSVMPGTLREDMSYEEYKALRQRS